MNKKKLVLLFYYFIFISSLFAFSKETHNLDTVYLFVNGSRDNGNYSVSKFENVKEICLLYNALYLTLDFSDNDMSSGKTSLEYLKNNTFMNFPTLNEISTPGSSWHEKYTHLGWDYQDYSTNPKTNKINNAQVKWLKRKKILIDTVNYIFDFNVDDENESNLRLQKEELENYEQYSILEKYQFKYAPPKSTSMAAVLYYTHVLGDIANNSENTRSTRVDLNNMADVLQIHLINLFKLEYFLKKSLVTEIINCKKLKSNENIDYNKYTESAKKLLEELQINFTELIENKYFYKNTDLHNKIMEF